MKKGFLLLILVVFSCFVFSQTQVSLRSGSSVNYFYDEIKENFSSYFEGSSRLRLKMDDLICGFNFNFNLFNLSYFMQPEIYGGLSILHELSSLELTAGPTVFMIMDNSYYNALYLDLKARLTPFKDLDNWLFNTSFYGGCYIGLFQDKNLFKDYLFYFGFEVTMSVISL